MDIPTNRRSFLERVVFAVQGLWPGSKEVGLPVRWSVGQMEDRRSLITPTGLTCADNAHNMRWRVSRSVRSHNPRDVSRFCTNSNERTSKKMCSVDLSKALDAGA
ncbi:unnamed protein product [Nesidiocoris tenuis]|uniref:Uncharacterized protein n=1 Tax=Nesidiocoris tenuis TaxID=355587 RepID=A0A6H5GJG2_9HEMI|nr:unnamed protein product [Nesidiocoris tenuis]